MKSFAKSIKFDEDQDKVSLFLESLSRSVKQVEEGGGIVEQIYIARRDEYDEQTSSMVYFEGDAKNLEDGSFGLMDHKRFVADRNTTPDAYQDAAKQVNTWLTENNDVDLFDVRYNFHVGGEAGEVAVVDVFYIDKTDKADKD